MSLPVRLSGEAGAELHDAARWYDERQPNVGGALLAAADGTFDSIRAWPRAGSPVERTRARRYVRRMRTGRFPNYAAYVVRDDHLLVVAIAHERRRPRYWNGRVRGVVGPLTRFGGPVGVGEDVWSSSCRVGLVVRDQQLDVGLGAGRRRRPAPRSRRSLGSGSSRCPGRGTDVMAKPATAAGSAGCGP